MRETRNLEFKQDISNSFLKTVSAFANYGTGRILFGVLDNGEICGISDPVKACLDIENKINDSIDPVPRYTLTVNKSDSTITLTVNEGIHKPYLYKSRAYIRNDSATIETDRTELTRLILEGENSSYEELKSKNQNLTFLTLEKKLKENLNIESVSCDTLKTLELYSDRNGYNIAAELLSDKNSFPGIDSARFGENINIIMDRETFSKESVLSQYEKIINKFQKYYTFEVISNAYREKKEMIPEAAFREAVANALVHRTWDVNADIRVAMYTDKIEITSPGGLPNGITKDEYLNGGISIPRNYILCSVFMRLKMIERFGTGIRRINDLYSNSNIKPQFNITENTIGITLPLLSDEVNLSSDCRLVYDLLKNHIMTSSDVIKNTGFGKNKTVSILNRLIEKGYIKKTGNGRSTKYTV